MSRSQAFNQLIPTNKPNRNSFDLSFSNNFSTKFGTLTPVLCKEVIPGDTFKIDSAFGLNLMPMVFPVQTRMRARLHFFYVRNRNLWKHWKQFLRGDSSFDMPYIGGTATHLSEFFKNNTLADYLGCPTSVVSSFTSSLPLNLFNVNSYTDDYSQYSLDTNNHIYRYFTPLETSSDSVLNKTFFNSILVHNLVPATNQFGFVSNTTFYKHVSNKLAFSFTLNTAFENFANIVFPSVIDGYILLSCPKGVATYSVNGSPNVIQAVARVEFKLNSTTNTYTCTTSNTCASNWQIDSLYETVNHFVDKYGFCQFSVVLSRLSFDTDKFSASDLGAINSFSIDGVLDTNDTDNSTAYVEGALRVNALPFRAYESIYNAIYRNTQNDPFIDSEGNINYDDFITTDNDGCDSTNYELYQDYWEKDFLTTCLRSPQDGSAPLLGLSNTPISSDNVYNLSYSSDDGSLNSIRVTEDSTSHALSFSANGPNHDLQGDIDALNSARDFGISINDLRNVNSLQRWLEKNISNGYSYKDIIESHFGIEISLRELNMPEFLGGITQDINITPITQTSESGTTPLGWQAGQGSVFAKMQHGIDKYCDEHGFIIGILSVVPVPCYSQLLPKMFTKFNQLDYYTPEFSHIGLQPVPYREVCPLQAYLSGTDLSTVFGYNRAFYDYLASTDEVHAEFRSSLRDFIINRVFATAPELGKEFLRVDTSQTNNIFSVTLESDHKIFGQIYFDIKAIRPIPLYNEPRLE